MKISSRDWLVIGAKQIKQFSGLPQICTEFVVGTIANVKCSNFTGIFMQNVKQFGRRILNINLIIFNIITWIFPFGQITSNFFCHFLQSQLDQFRTFSSQCLNSDNNQWVFSRLQFLKWVFKSILFSSITLENGDRPLMSSSKAEESAPK